jgi:hypothetical protein
LFVRSPAAWNPRTSEVKPVLEVLGQADGYHEIERADGRREPDDTLTSRRPVGWVNLRCSDPSLPVDSENLMIKAADR